MKRCTAVSALPCGTRFESGAFRMMGNHVIFWTSTENDPSYAWTRMLDYNQSGIFSDDQAVTKGHGIAVRCIID